MVNPAKLWNERDKKIAETRRFEIVRPLVENSKNAQNGFIIVSYFKSMKRLHNLHIISVITL